MSEESKLRLGNWATWFFRGTTILAGFFLWQTYQSIEENNHLLFEIKSTSNMNDLFYRTRLETDRKDIERQQSWIDFYNRDLIRKAQRDLEPE